jgi:misacylated tRNA(Ala) deacylase
MDMTEKTYYQDSYQQSLAATVTKVTGIWVEFDKTIFYPVGGGQPGDTGSVCLSSNSENAHRIVATEKAEDPNYIRHQLDSEAHNLKVGDDVNLQLDWERRYKLMKMHTCMHLLGSLIPVPVTGGSVGAEKSRLDFDLGEHQINKEDLTTEINKLINAEHGVVFGSITDEELDENPDLIRTMSVQPPRGSGIIRMVKIGDIDYQPCGGTHLNNVAEIGPIRISKIENKGKRNRRVHIVFSEE